MKHQSLRNFVYRSFYVLMIFAMLLVPYTTPVYAVPDNNPDGIPNPQNQIPVSDDANFGHIDPDNQADVMLNLEIPYYNTAECEPGMAPNADNSSGTISGNDNEEKVFNFLRTATFGGHKLNAAQIAGIMGNLKAEHGFQTNSTGNGFHGLAQWGDGRWNNDWEGKLEPQLQHLKAEMDSGDWHNRLERNGFFNLSNSKDDAVAAAYIFARNYEVAIKNGGGSEKWNGNDGEADNFIQNWSGRKNNAIDFYNKYASKVDGPNAGANVGNGSGPYVWVGDSRTVAMKTAVGKDGDKDRWVAESGANYNWFDTKGVPGVSNGLKPNEIIVFNMGVNDLGNADKYINRLKGLASGEWKSNKIVIVSVNPVDDTKSKNAKNAAIKAFNDKLKSELSGISNISFVDTNSKFPKNFYTDPEGVHYNADQYKKIYEQVKNDITNKTSSLDSQVLNSSCSPSSGDAPSAGATKYAKNGAKIYSQTDAKWVNHKWGNGTIGTHGCGVCAMAMILTAITGRDVSPIAVADATQSLNTGGGSPPDLPEKVAPKFGAKVEAIPASVDGVNKALDRGGMVWVCGRGAAPFTSVGHCIGIRGRTDSGKWVLFDSGSSNPESKDPDHEYDPASLMSKVNTIRNGTISAVFKQ